MENGGYSAWRSLQGVINIKWTLLIAIWLMCLAAPSFAQFDDMGEQDEFKSQPRLLTIESFELIGTSRINEAYLERELGIVSGASLDGDFVWKTRQRLLGLGIFKSVLLYMKKGKAQGRVHLVIECEDDPNVLGAWAMGAMAGVTYSTFAGQGAPGDASPVDFQLDLVGRNIAKRLYRGELGLGVDVNGSLDQAHLAWGLPRFAAEDRQIDAQITVNNVRQRYFDCLGFCGEASALLSRDAGDYSWWNYGLALLRNEGDAYAMPYFPAWAGGPQASWIKDTRLKGFVMGDGYNYGASLTFNMQHSVESTLKADLAYTKSLWELLNVTLAGQTLFIGARGVSTRLNGLVDIPLYHESRSTHDHAKIYLKWQYGADRYGQADLAATATSVGIRCHSFGLIADIALKVVTLPHEIYASPWQRMGVPLD